jgi:hypothetical protein
VCICVIHLSKEIEMYQQKITSPNEGETKKEPTASNHQHQAQQGRSRFIHTHTRRKRRKKEKRKREERGREGRRERGGERDPTRYPKGKKKETTERDHALFTRHFFGSCFMCVLFYLCLSFVSLLYFTWTENSEEGKKTPINRRSNLFRFNHPPALAAPAPAAADPATAMSLFCI